MTVLGQWVFDAPRVALEPRFLEEAAELGLVTQAVMLDTSKAPWDPMWSRAELEQFCRRAIDLDLETVCTVWLCPQRAVIDAMIADLSELLRVGPVGVDGDAEGLWVPEMVRGFADLEEATRYLLGELRRICEPLDVRIELDTHPWTDEGYWTAAELERWLRLDEEARLGELGPNVDRIFWQAYSTVKTPTGKPVPYYSRLGPGNMQRFALSRACQVPGVAEGQPKLGVGLAAYGQRWTGHDPIDAMATAYSTALSYRPVEVRFWGSVQIMGARRNGYAARFLRSLQD